MVIFKIYYHETHYDYCIMYSWIFTKRKMPGVKNDKGYDNGNP